MKKYHLIWMIGVFLLVIGISVVISYTNLISENYPNLSILISNVSLEPNESIDGFVTLEKDEKIYVTISAQPIPNSLYFSINNFNNSFSNEFIINDFISFPLIANATDSFNIVVGNIGHEIVSVSGFTTKNPILDDKELNLVYGTGVVIGSFVIIIGIFLIIIGIIIFVIKKKLSKKNLTNK